MENIEEKDILSDRAWVEVDLSNLVHNIEEIKKIISPNCKIMAVVKADAYGAGMVEVSRKLSDIGINDFAVATLGEAINLRKSGIKGNILILGYTNFEDLKYVIKYKLIQTIVDYEYAKIVSNTNFSEKLKVHVKINTGMNRIGESYRNIDNITKIYDIDNIDILGIFSHFSVADSGDPSDIEFTYNQIKNFNSVLKSIKELGYNTGYAHIQSSYGILNYQSLNYDYVRPGIIMYGIHSDKETKEKFKIDLKPVISLKAKITCIREITPDESVSYGRKFSPDKLTKIAAISIGYADGYPRNLSCKDTKVLVNNKYASVVGRICMDQLMIDVTDMEDIKIGDVVTLIGDGIISAEELSYKAGIITHELISRLGKRLDYIYIDND